MDFDLFETEQDDELLLSIPIEPTIPSNGMEIGETIPQFHCQGEDSIHSQFARDGFIRNKFLNSYMDNNNKNCIDAIRITDYKFGRDQLHSQLLLDFIFGNCCNNIQHIAINAKHTLLDHQQKDSGTHYQKRHDVTLLYHLILHTLDERQWPFIRNRLESIKTLINSLTIPKQTWNTFFMAHNFNGNECNSASYHLLHGILEWKFLNLCILHKYEWINNLKDGDDNCNRNSGAKLQEIYSTIFMNIEDIFHDLIACSICLYKTKSSSNLLHLSPFPCTCIKEMWLLLQLALSYWSIGTTLNMEHEKITFWMVFNKVMDKIKNNNYDNFPLTIITYSEFSVWLLQALVRLHGYRSDGKYEGPHYGLAIVDRNIENIEFCEKITQHFLQHNPSEEQLRVHIILLTPILLEWWPSKVNIPVLLWEYYYKKLNSSFYIMGSSPSNLAVACPNGRTYVEKCRILLKKTVDNSINSYTLFIILLGKCLERFLKRDANHQTQKLLGRIYSKFSVQKFFTLNETGLHHLIELFVVLSLCGDFNEIAPKLRDKLLAIELNKLTAAKQLAITKGHMALWILFAEQQCDLTEYITKLLKQLAAIHNDIAVSKIIADTMLDIYKQSYDFHCGEHLLIGLWLSNFLNNCAPAEQERTLEALHMIFEKLKMMDTFPDSGNNIIKALNNIILPFVKEQYITNRSTWLPQLAADFCTHPLALAADGQNFHKLFTHFIETQTIDHRNQLRFLLKVLDSKFKASINQSTIMHIWLKSLVLLSNANEEVSNLTKIIIDLNDFHYMTNLSKDDLLNAKEPLCNFIAAVGKTYDNCCANNDTAKRNRITQNLNLYWRNFEKWLPETINTVKIMEIERNDATSRFYSFLAIVIYNCPEVVYVKSKISCFFHVAMTRFILPISIQMGKTPDGKLTQIVHKIWPVLLQGIGRLNFKTDAYLTKTISDLLQKWTPYFKISSNSKIVARPFVHLLNADNHELSLHILNKMAQLFLITQRRQADQHACLIITIFHEILETLTTVTTQCNDDMYNMLEHRLLTFVKGTSLICLEHIMMVDEFVPSRTLLIDLFRHLLQSSIYTKSILIKELLAEHLRLLTKKHLAYYTFFFFDLLMKLASINIELITNIMDFLLQEVQIVEHKRGVDKDNRIRECLQKLNEVLRITNCNR